MFHVLPLLLSVASAASPPHTVSVPADMQPNPCPSCEAWNAPQTPFRIHGESWYVGTRGLASVLIDSGEGLILLDGALPQSAASIAANIESLGYRLDELRWILNSHAHFDHAGGIAALARMSGARVAASPRGAAALRAGTVPADDPQHGMGEIMRFPAVTEVVEVADGAQVALGEIAVTAHATPGHTPGGTTWSWESCEDGSCRTIVYADSLTPLSADGFRYSDADGSGARVAQFRASIERVASLRCDVLVATHPEAAKLFEREAARTESPDGNPFVDGEACRAYAQRYAQWLDKRLAQEQATATAP